MGCGMERSPTVSVVLTPVEPCPVPGAHDYPGVAHQCRYMLPIISSNRAMPIGFTM